MVGWTLVPDELPENDRRFSGSTTPVPVTIRSGQVIAPLGQIITSSSPTFLISRTRSTLGGGGSLSVSVSSTIRDGLFRPRAWIVAKERNRRGIVVQLVQADVELANHVGHDSHDQIRVQRQKDPIQAPADAIVIEMLELIGPQVKEFGREVPRPLGHSVDRLARDQQVAQQDQRRACRADFGASVFGRKVLLEKLVQPHPPQQSPENGDRPERMREDGLAAAGLGSSASQRLLGAAGLGVSITSSFRHERSSLQLGRSVPSVA